MVDLIVRTMIGIAVLAVCFLACERLLRAASRRDAEPKSTDSKQAGNDRDDARPAA